MLRQNDPKQGKSNPTTKCGLMPPHDVNIRHFGKAVTI